MKKGIKKLVNNLGKKYGPAAAEHYDEIAKIFTEKIIEKNYKKIRGYCPREYEKMMDQIMEGEFEVVLWQCLLKYNGKGDLFGYLYQFVSYKMKDIFKRKLKEENFNYFLKRGGNG